MTIDIYLDELVDVGRVTGGQTAKYDQDFPTGVAGHVPARTGPRSNGQKAKGHLIKRKKKKSRRNIHLTMEHFY